MRPFLPAFVFVAVFFVSIQSLSADLVSTSFSGNVSADINGSANTDTGSGNMDTLGASINVNNSDTHADLNWNWDANTNTLTGSSLLTAEKTVSAKPGVNHDGDSTLTFTFTIDSEFDFDLDIDWGFDYAFAAPEDNFSIVLTGTTSGEIFNASTTGTTGVASDSYLNSGTLLADTYSLIITGSLVEAINNQNQLNGGMTLNSFTLSTTAVPEPGAALFCILGLATLLKIRRVPRPKNHAGLGS